MSVKIKAILVILSLTVVSTLVVLRAQNKPATSEEKETVSDFEKRFPIVDMTAPEPTDPEVLVRRRAIGERYDKAIAPLSDVSQVITSNIDWETGLSAFPFEKSEAVVIGEVVDAQAHLSNNKTAVYSEFKVRLNEVLKGELGVNSEIFTERHGGRVRYPSGHITLFFIRGQGMPVIGRRYVLFLTREDKQINFNILTGYEFKDGKIATLDNPGRHVITKQRGKDESTFLTELRAKSVRPS